MPKNIKLSTGATTLLRNVLSTVGWATTMELLFAGGELLVKVLPKLEFVTKLKPKKDGQFDEVKLQKEYATWVSAPGFDGEITDDHLKAITTALEKLATDQKLQPTAELYEILVAIK